MATRKIKIDFFKIANEMSDSLLTFASCLRAINDLSDVDRTEEMDGYPFRLTEFSENTEFVAGDIIKVRMNDLPVRANKLHGKGEDLGFDPDDGIGEETAFLYYKPSGILITQRNKYGTSHSKLISYIHRKAPAAVAFISQIILEKNTSRKYGKIGDFKKISVSVASPESIEMATTEAFSLPPAPVVNISMSMGTTAGLLDRVKSFSIIERFQNNPSTRKLEVVGIDEETKQRVALDLLNDRMIEEGEISSHTRHVSYAERARLLNVALSTRKNELDSRFTT